MIETARLWLVRFDARFLSDEYVSWLNDPAVVRFSQQRLSHHTIASCTAYMQSFEGTPNQFWAILRKDQNLHHIGNMNVYLDQNDRVADLGILIGDRDSTAMGFGLEAWQGLVKHLLSTTDVRKISAGTLALNQPMLAIMRKSGMLSDGVRQRHCLIEGQAVDVVHMALFRNQT